jgi:uncharacterized protein (DUF1697 family)
MPTYVALLRAVNVGGTWVKMSELVALIEALGYVNVAKYIQSVNIIFSSTDDGPKCCGAIEAALEKHMGRPVDVIVKSAKELSAIAAGNPFLAESGIDATKLHVTFLKGKPTKAGLAKLASIDAGADGFHCKGAVLYVHCPNGYGRSKLANAAIERTLGVPATTRNWQTVNTLVALAARAGTDAANSKRPSKKGRSR